MRKTSTRNVRSITSGDCHLSDAMIEAIAGANGVIGLVLGNSFPLCIPTLMRRA